MIGCGGGVGYTACCLGGKTRCVYMLDLRAEFVVVSGRPANMRPCDGTPDELGVRKVWATRTDFDAVTAVAAAVAADAPR
jgi:hypothetical protein